MRIELSLLGGFRAFADGRAVAPAALTHRSLELVKLLAVRREHRTTKAAVLEAVWPHLDEEAGTRALHKAASLARTAFGNKALIVLHQGAVLLAPEDELIVDVDVFEADAQRALADEDDDACAAVAGRYGGVLLPEDVAVEWTQEPRDRLAATHLRLLREASAWEDVVALDPTDEEAQRSLMRWHLQTGNRAAALRQFRLLKDALARELAAQPEPETVALYEEIARAMVPAPSTERLGLIGRDVELVRGRAILRKAMEGEGGTLLVAGDAGVGKTRLCDALLDEAKRLDVDVARGAAHADGAQPPFGPVVEAIARLLEARVGLREKLGEETLAVLARLGALLSAAGAEPTGARSSDAVPLQRQSAFAAIERVLVVAASERPVVVFIDDAHDADASTLDLLAVLARAVRGRRSALVLTMRTGAPAGAERMRQRTVAQAGAWVLELHPLTREESALLVGRGRGDAADPALADAVWSRARGNPFLTELLSTGPALDDNGAPTLEVLRLVEARFARLDRPLRALVERAAVMGDELTAEALLALFGSEPDDGDAAQRLDDAVAAGVLVPSRAGFRFRHALLRESLLAGLTPARRKALHARAAHVLASTGGRAGDIATHLALSGDGPGAAPWFVQAAGEQAALGAWDTALAHVEAALAHGLRDAAVLSLFGDLCFATADPRAAAAYEEALRSADDDERPALLIALGTALMNAGDIPGAVGALASVVAPEDPDLRARYLYVRSALAWFMGKPDEADALSSEAIAFAPRVKNRVLVAENVMMRSAAADSRGQFEAQVRADFLQAVTDPAMIVAINEGYICAAEGFLYGGRPYPEVAKLMREIIGVAQKGGVRRAVAFSRCVLGGALLLQGDLDEALEELRASEAQSRELGAYCGAALSMQRQAEVYILRGQKELARPLLAAAYDVARLSPIAVRHVLQRIQGAQVRAARTANDAAVVVEESAALLRGPHETCHACMITLAVPSTVAHARVGNVAGAGAHLAVARGSMNAFWRASSGWHAAVAEAQAEVHVAEGKVDDAREHLHEAASLFEHIGQPLDLERVRTRVGAL